MAIDYWEYSGLSTSYSPLESYTGVDIFHQGTFVVTFKAKSKSSTLLMLSANADFYFRLTPDWKEYSCEMEVYNFISVSDEDGFWDAFIKDLKVVEKPLDKLTNNMLDGFGMVGDNIWWWDSYEVLPQIIEDNGQYLAPGTYEIEYEARSDNEFSSFYFWTVQPGRNVTMPTIYQPLTLEWERYFHRITITEHPVSDYYVSDGDETDVSSVRNMTVRKLDSKWKLHENARLIDSHALNSGSGQNISEIIYQLNPGTYTLSCVSNAGTLYARDITTSDNSANNLAVVDYTAQPKQFTLATPRKVAIRHYGGSVEKPMLNLGYVPLPYEPKNGDRFRTNATPKVKVPKKNLFDGEYVLDESYGTANGQIASSIGFMRNKNRVRVKPNTAYILSLNKSVPSMITYLYDGNGVYINYITNSYSFTTPSNCEFVNFRYAIADQTIKTQIEQGTTTTPYEPYQEVLPGAKRVLPAKRVLEARR
jgi:hypothetical protein